jgi:hypothetical protein
LAEAQSRFIRALASRTDLDSEAAAMRAAAEWLQNAPPALAAARQWAGRADLPASGPVQELAKSVQTMIDNSTESAQVTAMLTYGRQPAALLEQTQVAQASLAIDPPPAGSRPTEVKDVQTRIGQLAGELETFRARLKCESCEARVRDRIAALQGVQKTNRDRFLAYWNAAYDNWKPADWIESIPSWEALKRDPLIRDRELSLRIRRELSRFVTYVEGFQTQQVGPVVGDAAQRLTELKDLITLLDRDAERFIETVDAADLDKLKANDQIKTRERDLDAIASGGSTLRAKFRPYPQKVRLLLDAQAEFRRELDRRLTLWSPQLSGRFPFALAASALRTSGQTVEIDQASVGQLRDFFYGQDSPVVFIGQHQDLYSQWSVESRNAGAAQFLARSLALRDFFFDKESGQYRALKFEGTYTGYSGQESQGVGQISARLNLFIPGAAAEPVMVWWRSLGARATSPFTWTPGDYGSGDRGKFRFNSTDEGYGNHPAGWMSVGGDFAPLAIIVGQKLANPVSDGQRQRWTTRLSVIQEGATARYFGDFEFVIDPPMPFPLPDWNGVGGN